MRSKIDMRIYEIESELDKTDSWENPPYRIDRARLSRELLKLKSIREGTHPILVTRSGADTYQRLSAGEKFQYRQKRKVLQILATLK